MFASSLLFGSENNKVLITFTALDLDIFHYILPSFSYFYSTYSPYGRRGRNIVFHSEKGELVDCVV